MPEEVVYDEWMSEGDALIWQIERDPLLRSTVVSVWVLDRAPDPSRWRETVERSVAAIPRLRQRVVEDSFGIAPPRWEIDPHFDLGYHVRTGRVGGDGSVRSLFDLAAPIAMQAFDKDRPLWEFHLVDGLSEGRAGVIMKIHHAVSDGMGMVRMTESMVETTREPDAEWIARRDARLAAQHQELRSEPLSELDQLREAVAHRADSFAERAARFGRALGRGVGHVAANPVAAAERLRDKAGSLGRLLQPVSEPLSPIMTGRSLTTHLDGMIVPVEALKRAGKATPGGTLNDAFVASVAGGLRIYHDRHGASVEELRMNMPVNVREGAEGQKAGNQFVPARFAVPIAIADPTERMCAIHEIVTRLRAEPAMGMIDDVNTLFTRLGSRIATGLAGSMMKALDFVTSNVPGPRRPIYTAGARILHMYPFGPLAGAAANITLFSYAGEAQIGINTDTAPVPDPDVFRECLEEGFAEVLATGGGEAATDALSEPKRAPRDA